MVYIIIFIIWSVITAVFDFFFHSIYGILLVSALIIVLILHLAYTIIEKLDGRNRD